MSNQPTHVTPTHISYGPHVKKGRVFYDDGKAIHVCMGDEVHRGVFLLWTLCEIDVPANKGYEKSDEAANCKACLLKLDELAAAP